MAKNHKFLVKKAVTNQAKPNPSSSSSSSSRKPKAKSGKNKTKSQETPTNLTKYSDISIFLGVLT